MFPAFSENLLALLAEPPPPPPGEIPLAAGSEALLLALLIGSGAWAIGRGAAGEVHRRKLIVFLVVPLLVVMVYFLVRTKGRIVSADVDPVITGAAARLLAPGVNLLGSDLHAQGDRLVGRGTFIQVSPGCLGAGFYVVFLAYLAAFPCRWKVRIAGLGFGVILITALNYLRMVVLLMIHQQTTGEVFRLFDRASGGILALITFGVWSCWLWVHFLRKRRPGKSSPERTQGRPLAASEEGA